MNKITISTTDGVHACTCGAKASGKDVKRFLTRHPEKCSKRQDFNKRLAAGTKCVDDGLPTLGDYVGIETYALVRECLQHKDLTLWETDFLVDLREASISPLFRLTPKQQEKLLQIHKTRV